MSVGKEERQAETEDEISAKEPKRTEFEFDGSLLSGTSVDTGMNSKRELEKLHRKFLVQISDLMVPASAEYKKFVEISKAFGVSNNILEECRNDPFKCFEALESAGNLRAGYYTPLKTIAKDSGNVDLLKCINEAESNQLKVENSTAYQENGDGDVQQMHLAEIDHVPGLPVYHDDDSEAKGLEEHLAVSCTVTSRIPSSNSTELESIHRKLLTKISDFMIAGSEDYKKFLEHVKPYVSRNIVAQNHTNLLKIFEALENGAWLTVGNYTHLKTIARDSNNNVLLQWIDETEKNIKIKTQDSAEYTVLQNDLILYYRNTCSNLQISPLFDEYGYSSNLLKFHVPPKLMCVALPGDGKLNEQSNSVAVRSYHDIFMKNSNICRRIYISSPAGCGKTSMVKRMALTWCHAHQPIESDNQWFIQEDVDEMKKFKYLFLIFLRGSNRDACYIDIMIQKQLFVDLDHSVDYTDMKFLQKVLSDEKCLIIMDGLDEWSHPQHDSCSKSNEKIPHTRAWPNCTVLATTRPWKLDVATLKPNEIDQKLQMNGLDDDLLAILINGVIKQMNKLHNKSMKADDFEEELKVNKVTTLSRIPVIVMQLLTLWFDGERIGQSQCEIYCNMIEFFLKCYYAKKDKKVMELEMDNKLDLPCLRNNIHCKAHMELLLKLGELAFYALFCANQESSLVFDLTFTKKYLNNKYLEISREVGILVHDKRTGKMSIRQSDVWFLHKTFQEFLAAFYISMHLDKIKDEISLNKDKVNDIEDKINKSCNSVEKILDMSQIFMFMSGLCPHIMSRLCERLRDVVSADSRTKKYRSSCQVGPGHPFSREGEALRQVQDTMIDCLQESLLNDQKNVCLPLDDAFIAGFSRPEQLGRQWSNVLMSLVQSNSICSLSVVNEWKTDTLEDILNSVNEVSYLQKLWLYSVPGDFVFSVLSRYNQSLNTKSATLQHLECVTLWVVHDWSSENVCSLVDLILQFPKSVLVRLESCDINEGTIDWREYIHSHPQITVDEDINNEDDDMLQFHTNKA